MRIFLPYVDPEREIGEYWIMKVKSIGIPNIYFSNKVSNVTLENGVSVWSFRSSQYVQSVVQNMEKYLCLINQSLPKYAPDPFITNYHPRIDTSSTFNDSDSSYYQLLIGILGWIVELDRVDITCEVSMMISMIAVPLSWHLDQLFICLLI